MLGFRKSNTNKIARINYCLTSPKQQMKRLTCEPQNESPRSLTQIEPSDAFTCHKPLSDMKHSSHSQPQDSVFVQSH